MTLEHRLACILDAHASLGVPASCNRVTHVHFAAMGGVELCLWAGLHLWRVMNHLKSLMASSYHAAAAVAYVFDLRPQVLGPSHERKGMWIRLQVMQQACRPHATHHRRLLQHVATSTTKPEVLGFGGWCGVETADAVAQLVCSAAKGCAVWR